MCTYQVCSGKKNWEGALRIQIPNQKNASNFEDICVCVCVCVSAATRVISSEVWSHSLIFSQPQDKMKFAVHTHVHRMRNQITPRTDLNQS